jgi:hypothetical protein
MPSSLGDKRFFGVPEVGPNVVFILSVLFRPGEAVLFCGEFSVITV